MPKGSRESGRKVFTDFREIELEGLPETPLAPETEVDTDVVSETDPRYTSVSNIEQEQKMGEENSDLEELEEGDGDNMDDNEDGVGGFQRASKRKKVGLEGQKNEDSGKTKKVSKSRDKQQEDDFVSLVEERVAQIEGSDTHLPKKGTAGATGKKPQKTRDVRGQENTQNQPKDNKEARPALELTQSGRARRAINDLKKMIDDGAPDQIVADEFRRIFEKINDTNFAGNEKNNTEIKDILKGELGGVYEYVMNREPEKKPRSKDSKKIKDDADQSKEKEVVDSEPKKEDNVAQEDKKAEEEKEIPKSASKESPKKVSSKIFKESFDFENDIEYRGIRQALNNDGFILFANEYASANGFDFNEKVESNDKEGVQDLYEKYVKTRVACKEIVEGYKSVIAEKLNLNKEDPQAKSSVKISLDKEAVENIELYIERLVLGGQDEKVNEIYETVAEYKAGPEKINEAERELYDELLRWKAKAGNADNAKIKEYLRSEINRGDEYLKYADALEKTVRERGDIETPIEKVMGAFPDAVRVNEHSVYVLKKISDYKKSSYLQHEGLVGKPTTVGALALWTGESLKDIEASIDDLCKMGFIKLGSNLESPNDANKHITILANPEEILPTDMKVVGTEWLSRLGKAWTPEELTEARKIYNEQEVKYKHKPNSLYRRIREVGKLVRKGWLSNSEAGGLGLFGRMFGTTKKIKLAAENIRAKHGKERDEHAVALENLEQLEKKAAAMKHRYQTLREKVVGDKTITHLVKYSLTKEIGRQITAKIQLAEKDNNEHIFINHLNRGQEALDRVNQHTDSGDVEEENLLVDPKEVKQIQKEIDKAFKEILEKRVHKVIDDFEKQKSKGFDAFRNALMKTVRVPGEEVRYGSAKGSAAKEMVLTALKTKKAELIKTIESQDNEDKKVADKIKVSQISGLISEINAGNTNATN